jgi:hypothetical protein
MRRGLSLILFLFTSLIFPAGVQAQDIVVPAGTLLNCTINEPNLSSVTVNVGDPFICHLSGLEEFGHVVFPRGSYLGGHIESYKEPGHFFGKGNLKLTFDRIGLPASDIPVPSKITGVSGYRVDRKGDIVGHGHAKRDTVEWLLPPLWPWKVITLPARGPRPALKGEQQITVRLMDDVVVPRSVSSASLNGISSFQRPHASSQPASFQTYGSLSLLHPGSNKVSYAPPSVPAMEDEPTALLSTDIQSQVPHSRRETPQVRVSFIALKSGEIYAVARYRIDDGSLSYELTTGQKGSIDLPEVDWRETSRLNSWESSSTASNGRR